MVDTCFEDCYLASLYDRLHASGRDETYYLHLALGAPRVLDVGCGTGRLLRDVRDAGHRGRLCGLDPGTGMLEQARRYPGIEWVAGTLPESGFESEFELIVMTGHAFQVLLTDDGIRAFLAAAHRALAAHGRFAFETANPHVRPWEAWTPDNVTEISDDDGTPIRVWYEVERVDGELVTFTENYASDAWDAPKVSRGTLRYLPAGCLDHLLRDAGFVVDERYGGWDRSLCTPASREIITVAEAS